jgi:hypothetical protein
LKDDKEKLQNDYTMKIKIEWEEDEEEEDVFQGVDVAKIDEELKEEVEVVEEKEPEEEVYKLPVQLRLSSVSQDGEVGIKFN